MKKITTFFILFFLVFKINVNAQKEITTVHLYDITNPETVKNYKESIIKVNQIIAEISYPKNYYTFLSVNDSDKSENYKYATIGHWASDADYIAIHENAKYKAWSEENKKNAVYVKDQLYRKLYKVE